jgi:hypothetical protein
MTKNLACRLGRHDWTTRVESGDRYKVCAACGKTPLEPVQGHGVVDESIDHPKEGQFPDDTWGGISGPGGGTGP